MKPHFSATQLSMYAKCGEQYRRRYIEGERIPPSASLALGRAGHGAIEKNLLAKIASGELLPVEEVGQIARDILEAEWGEVELQPEEKAAPDKVKGRMIDTSVAVSTAHAKLQAPKLEPTEVEKAWRVEIANFPRDLVGYMDILEAGRRALRDTKITGKSPAATAADDSLQLTLYAMAAQVVEEIENAALHLDHVVHYKKAAPKVVTQKTARTPAHYKGVLERVYRVDRAIEAGIFTPANPEVSWWCSDRWCGYWKTCPFAQKRPVSVPGSDLLVKLEESAEVTR